MVKNIGIKVLAGVAGAGLAFAYVSDMARRLKKDQEEYKKKEPFRLLDYMLSRVVVICPRCGHIVKLETIESQFSNHWKCFKCGCAWEETSHCDRIIE